MEKNPNIVYGQLSANLDITGYCHEKAMQDLKYLLKESRWKEIGTGFKNINDFVRSLSNYWSQWKILAEQRKEIALMLHEEEVSQRAIADMVGVSDTTIKRDINKDATNIALEEKNTTGIEDVTNIDATYVAPPQSEPVSSGEKIIKQQSRKEEKKQKKEEEKKKKIIEGGKINITIGDIKIYHGDFVEELDFRISDNSLDIIITDPPYAYEFIDCWSDLSLFASKKLKENGFCIAYSGHTYLPEVLEKMSENLNYYWMFALIHSGNKQYINHRNLFCAWKPLLIFQKGIKSNNEKLEDIIQGTGMEKEDHDWQQALNELTPIIENFTNPGDIICDPFLGSGTTAIASYKLKRKFIGAEKEIDQFNIAKNRINGILG